MTNLEIKTWDIFCRVIDNYGDIGVCWRLARQLASEYPFQIRLWVDEVEALKHIWPDTQLANQQHLENVDVRAWNENFDPQVLPTDVVIEAFACNLPDSYLAAMKYSLNQPHWFNLEYLSAEDWIEGCHGLQSIHPQLGLKKTFFFPGVTAQTGGLIKEKALFNEREQFLRSDHARANFLQHLGAQIQTGELPSELPGQLIVSLFGYENTAVSSLITAWIESTIPILCLVPAGKILPDICRTLRQDLKVGDVVVKGALRLQVIPFLNQIDYDRLLWTCDINFVRGEDSFVRAQWAAKPFIWHIYPQDGDFHLVKLDAFLHRYVKDLEPMTKAAIVELWHRWNSGKDCGSAWNEGLANIRSWQRHSRLWCQTLNSLGDLASNMVHFCQKTL